MAFCDGNDFRFANWRGYTAVLRRFFQDPKGRHFIKDFHYSKTCKTCTYLQKRGTCAVFSDNLLVTFNRLTIRKHPKKSAGLTGGSWRIRLGFSETCSIWRLVLGTRTLPGGALYQVFFFLLTVSGGRPRCRGAVCVNDQWLHGLVVYWVNSLPWFPGMQAVKPLASRF